MNRAFLAASIAFISLMSLLIFSNTKVLEFEESRVEQIVVTEKQKISLELDHRVESILLAFSRMSAKFDVDNDKVGWTKEVKTYISELSEIKQVEWVGIEDQEHWSFPEIIQKEVDSHDHFKQINLEDGNIFFKSDKKDFILLIQPTKRDGHINGYLVGHIQISSLINSFLKTDYSIKIFYGNYLVFRNRYSFNSINKRLKSFEYLNKGLKWTVILAPTSAVIGSYELYFVKLFLPIGCGLSIFFSILTYILLVQMKLKTEVIERKKQTDNIIKSFPDLTFIINQKGDVIESHNGTGSESFNVLQEFLGDNIFFLLPDGYAESFNTAIHSVLHGKEIQKVSFTLGFGNEDSHYEASLTMFDHHHAFMTIRDKTTDFEQKRSLEDQLSEEEVIKSLLAVATENLHFTNKLSEALKIILSLPWLKDDGRGGIYRVEDEKLELCVEQNLDDEVLIGCRNFPIGRFSIGKAAKEKQVVHLHSVDFENDFTYEGMKDHGKYIVPVISNGDVVGVITLYLFKDHRRNNQEIRYLTNIANALAPIFKNENLERELDKERIVALEKSRLAALGEMGGGIAHEINNPLFIVIGNISRLESQLKKPELDMVKILKIVKTINDTSWRMSKIVKGLREFSRDGSDDEFEEISLINVVDETLALCNEKLNNKSIKFEVIGDDVNFFARRIQFSQVILNLLQNSYDAICDDDGERWIKMYSSQSNNNLIVHYVDSGIGIPSQVREKIFQPFYTTKDIGKGTGLGLSISMGLIESHGGSLEYEELSGHTGFKITIPVRMDIKKAS
jgi:signal transduction histidine kinase